MNKDNKFDKKLFKELSKIKEEITEEEQKKVLKICDGMKTIEEVAGIVHKKYEE